MDRLVSIGEAAKLLGVTHPTLRKWTKDGTLHVARTQGGHRRYRLSDIEKMQGNLPEEPKERQEKVAIYARVSSHEQRQKGDLDRQKSRISEYCAKKNYHVIQILDDVGSGMSDSRSRLKTLFGLVRDKKITKVVVEHKDRLTRFNFGVYKEFFEAFGVEIEKVEDVLPKSYENELVEDMISLMSSFSAKVYGKRSAENRKKKKQEALMIDGK